MLQVARWRIIAVIAALVLGALFAAPNVLPASVRQELPAWLPKQGVNLGLDLKGGSYLMLQVDAEALEREQLLQLADALSTELRGAEPRIPTISSKVEGLAAQVRLTDAADLPRALPLAEALAPPVELPAGREGLDVASQPDGAITVALTREARTAMVRDAVSRSIEVIRRRIDELGTAEISIARQGEDRIVVQAPGQGDPEDLKRQIGQTAKLTFHLLDETADAAAAFGEGPLRPGSIRLPQPDRPDEPFIVVRERPLLSGDDLERAFASFDPQNGQPVVSFRFDPRGASVFGRTTTENVGKRFAIALDGRVITAPVINEPILGGSGQISGGFDVAGAEELSALLRAGALPAPLTVVEQRTVGPGLGQDSINAGAAAGAVAGLGVLVFMFMAYGVFGLFGVAALLVNALMVVAGMSVIGATLTLPGIAGLILTIAMAVDANVLIYERMREEQANGRGPALSVDAGFKRAWVAIFDANLTTLGAAAILFQFGAGPVRGFAWTLSLGVLTSVFTAVLVTQILIAVWFRAARPKKLPI